MLEPLEYAAIALPNILIFGALWSNSISGGVGYSHNWLRLEQGLVYGDL